MNRGYYPRERDGVEAALDGEAPGVVNGRGAVTAVTERLSASRPRGAAVLRGVSERRKTKLTSGPGVAATHRADAGELK